MGGQQPWALRPHRGAHQPWAPPLHDGCIPVIIMPGVHVQLEGVLDLPKFALRLERHQLPRIVEIREAVPRAAVAAMQAELAKVWERFTYSGLFKRAHMMQLRPPDALVRSRLGRQPACLGQRRSAPRHTAAAELAPRTH